MLIGRRLRRLGQYRRAVYSSGASVLIESTHSSATTPMPAQQRHDLSRRQWRRSCTQCAGRRQRIVDRVQFVNNATSCPRPAHAGRRWRRALCFGQGPTSVVSLDRVYFGQNEASKRVRLPATACAWWRPCDIFREHRVFRRAIYMLTRTGAPRRPPVAQQHVCTNSTSFGGRRRICSCRTEPPSARRAIPCSRSHCRAWPACRQRRRAACGPVSPATTAVSSLPTAAGLLTLQFPAIPLASSRRRKLMEKCQHCTPVGSVLIDNGINAAVHRSMHADCRDRSTAARQRSVTLAQSKSIRPDFRQRLRLLTHATQPPASRAWPALTSVVPAKCCLKAAHCIGIGVAHCALDCRRNR